MKMTDFSVLIIDDVPSVREYLRQTLMLLGITHVSEASNGSLGISVPNGPPSRAAITWLAERAAATGIPRDKITIHRTGLDRAVFRPLDRAEARARLAEMDWRWQEFAPLWDVDRGEDLERLNACFPASLDKASA